MTDFYKFYNVSESDDIDKILEQMFALYNIYFTPNIFNLIINRLLSKYILYGLFKITPTKPDKFTSIVAVNVDKATTGQPFFSFIKFICTISILGLLVIKFSITI